MNEKAWGILILAIAVYVSAIALAMHLQKSPHPITINSDEWVCTKEHTAPIGMAVASVCDQYTRKD
jgi:hypothetical protein